MNDELTNIIDIKKHSIESTIAYITELAVKCRKECIANKALDIDLNNDDVIKAFGYAYTNGYLQGQHDTNNQ